jgi:hypothetical protein
MKIIDAGHYKYKGYEICDAFVSKNHDGSDAMLYHEYDGIKSHDDIQKLVNYWQGRWYIRCNPENNDKFDFETKEYIEIYPNTYGNHRLYFDDNGKIAMSDIRFYPTLKAIKLEIDHLHECDKNQFIENHINKLTKFGFVSGEEKLV